YDRAAVSMSNYLRKYPNGLFSLKAHYYAADSYQRQGQPDKALPHYLQVCQSARCQWTETSLLTAAGIAYDDSNYVLADSLYAQLADMAENQSNRIIGRLGVLRCCVMLNRESAINAAADALLNEPRIETEHREEALIAKARLSYSQGLRQQVITLYEPLLTSTNGEYSGEAAYRRAECTYLTSGCKPAEKIINDIVQDMASDYWLAKTFILWADIYYNDHHNNLQAKQTLQSIIDNYEGAELRTIAQERLDAIILSEAADTQLDEEEDPMEIDM
ncbi:MAG: hypothetical protein KBT04_02830, partial [Bacteroidales bacterium]|nr:hypothetical protein [Candidatus Colimorpha onthohippi]